jgi:Fic family protein
MKESFLQDDEIEFLTQSNYIEGERLDALNDSVAAWKAVRCLKTITVKDVLNCHAVLMRTRTTIPPEAKGAWTTVRTRVGVFLNPEPIVIPGLMIDWVEKTNASIVGYRDEDMITRDEVARDFHVAFEKIHPFQDGNGRVGRILYEWHRLRLGLPIHVIREDERFAYYGWFRRKSSDSAKVQGWL